MADSRELRERLRREYLPHPTSPLTPFGDLVYALLDALDREDAERQQHAERKENNLLDRVYRTSCGHEWTMRHTACPTCFAEMRMDLALFKADRVVRQVFGGKQLLSLAALQPYAAGEHVECDDANEPRDGRQDGP